MGVVVNTIERFYQAFEEKVSRSMRVLLVVAVTVVLLSALFMVIIGAVKSGKDATLETEVDGLEYDKAKEILFNKKKPWGILKMTFLFQNLSKKK